MKFRCPHRGLTAWAGVLLAAVPSAQAGMTVYGLKDVYRLRFEEISFFIFLLLACAMVFRFLWNHGRKGIEVLPRIGFLQSLCISVVLGLGMMVILTMISGIREVLTPGAWNRQGSRYNLTHPSQDSVRERNLNYLRAALQDYARTHDGRFPAHDYVPEIPEKLWQTSDEIGTHYLYVGGLTTNHSNLLVAAEPLSFGSPRFVLMVNGRVKKLSTEEINAQWSLSSTP